MDVFLYSTGRDPNGYGQSQQWLFRELRKLGVNVSTKYTGQNIGLVFGYPTRISDLKTPVKIAYTMFESSRIPPAWFYHLQKADLIITPSKFCHDLFRDCGFENIKIPLGYDENVFKLRKRKKWRPFTFLHYDAFNPRKGWDEVLLAFIEEFGENEPVRLIFKTALRKSPEMASGFPKNIKVIAKDYSPKDLSWLLGEADCFVFPSRGEGFGYPPLEALATGCPTIIPNSSGMAEYFNPRYFMEVKTKGKIPALYDRFDPDEAGSMDDIDRESLKKAMRDAYQNREDHFSDAVFGSIWVRENYTSAKTAQLLKEQLEKFTDVRPVPERPVLSIIMLTYNALKYTKLALDSVKRYTRLSSQIIVVDNGSTDGTRAWLKRQEGIDLILNQRNEGVAGGRNIGLARADGEFAVFLDNDVEVGKNWDRELVDTFDKVWQCGVVGAKGNNVDSLNPLLFSNFVTSEEDKRRRGIFEVDVVPGFCFAFRRSLLKRIGNQTERLGKFWHEDLEFCLRAKEAGFRTYANNQINIIHHEHKSAGADKPLTDGEIKVKYPGFLEKAGNIAKAHRSSNIVTIYKNPVENLTSYLTIADYLTKSLRKRGIVAIRKPEILTPPVSFNHSKGFCIGHNGSRFIILHQENDRMPKDWLEALKTVDYAFCVSHHVYKLALKQGVPKEKLVDVSPDGVDRDIFNTNVMPATDLGNDFLFLTVGALQPRKGTDILIRAFSEEFAPDEPVKLYLKNYDYGWGGWIGEMIHRKRNIVHIFTEWDENYLARVYRRAAVNGAYVSTHRGEAFGLPILEAVACGARAGVTNWGGVKYWGKDSLLIDFFPYRLVPSTFHNWHKEPFYKKGENPQWAEPDLNAVKRWMRAVYNEGNCQKRARIESKEILKRFSWDVRMEKFIDALLEKGKIAKPFEITL